MMGWWNTKARGIVWWYRICWLVVFPWFVRLRQFLFNSSSNLLNHPELSTPTTAIKSFLLCRWCYRSLGENFSIPTLYYLSNPCFIYIVVISDISQIFFIPLCIFSVMVNDAEKRLFHNSILQTVERDNGKPTPRSKTVKTSIERTLQSFEFIIHCYSQSLKHARGCLYPTLPTSCRNQSTININPVDKLLFISSFHNAIALCHCHRGQSSNPLPLRQRYINMDYHSRHRKK